MIAAAMLIPLGDAVAKLAHAQLGAPIAFMAWSRFALGAVLLAPFALARGTRLAELTRTAVILRGLAISATVYLILQGVARAPLANVYGAFFIAPLISFALAVLLLKERPGAARYALIGLGFLGVLLVAGPGSAMPPGLIFALAAGVFYGIYLTASRAMSGAHRAMAMLWAQLIIGGVVLAPFAFAGTLPSGALFGFYVLLSASSSVLANYLILLAYQKVQASRLAPLVYVQLIAATVYGAVVFRTIPDLAGLAGLGLLLASGLGAIALRQRG